MRNVTVTATYYTTFTATVSVPDHWTNDQVREHYRTYGASGEFEEALGDWHWDEVQDAGPDEPVTAIIKP